MAINNNLYPPICLAYSPAFLINENVCRVYFSLSQYNSLEDIANAQVTICNQDYNLSVLDLYQYPCSIMLTDIKIDNEKTSDDKYYIEIKNSDIDGGFQINQYYKVQIRFTSKNAEPVSYEIPQSIDSWLSSNVLLFSEWSTVCLVRGISYPKLSLYGFDNDSDLTMWNSADIDIIGSLTFSDRLETDSLKNYNIKIYDAFENLVADSGTLYPDNYNGINNINYTLDYALQDGDSYSMFVEYETKNLYHKIERFDFIVIQSSLDILEANVIVNPDNNNGLININISAKDKTKLFTGNVTIRRASSKDNFMRWEDVKTFTIENDILDYNWCDSTVESGVWYKYCAQKRNSIGIRGAVTKSSDIVIVEYEDAFLVSEDGQLKLMLDPSVSSFKINIMETKTDTIGSKYPYIKRNGATNYKAFPLGGLISYFMDDDNVFTNKELLFGESLPLYEQYNKNQRIDDYENTILEKKFRDGVIQYLNKNNVKLFKSPTEGNILVKLMDINFTPNQTIGRHLYSFSCMAYEIDDFNIKNCDKYKVQEEGNYDTILDYSNDYLGQLNITLDPEKDVIDILTKEYKKYEHKDFNMSIDYLDDLSLNIESEPYLITEKSDGSFELDGFPSKSRLVTREEGKYLGYLLYINNKPIIVGADGRYQFRGEKIRVTSIKSPVKISFSLDYHIKTTQKEDYSKIVKSSNYYKKIGQYWGTFGYGESIYKNIWNKYYQSYKSYIQTLVSVDEIKIEADPGTVIFIKESEDDGFQRHVIGDTSVLSLKDENVSILDMYFTGKHFEEVEESEKDRLIIPDGKYLDTGILVNDFEELKNPINNGVYTFTQTVLKTLAQDDGKEGVTIEEELVEETGEDLVYHDDINYAADRVAQDNKHQITLDTSDVVIDKTYKNYELVGNDHKNAELTGLRGEYNLDDESVDIGELDLVVNNKNGSELVIDYSDTENKENIIGETISSSYAVKLLNEKYLLSSDDMTYGIDKLLNVKAKSFDAEQDTLYIYLKDNYADVDTETQRMILNRLLDKEFAVFLEELINDNNKYIWHNNRWWIFTKDHDIVCPVEGLIDYLCEIYKGVYAA